METEITKIEQRNEPTYIDYTKLYLRKVNRVKKIFGNATLHITLDNTFTSKASIYEKLGGEYRLMPYKLPIKGFCDFLIEDKLFYPELTEHSDFEAPFKCPMPAKTFAFREYSPSLKNAPLAAVHSGDYAVDIIIEKDQTVFLCFRIYGSVIKI